MANTPVSCFMACNVMTVIPPPGQFHDTTTTSSGLTYSTPVQSLRNQSLSSSGSATWNSALSWWWRRGMTTPRVHNRSHAFYPASGTWRMRDHVKTTYQCRQTTVVSACCTSRHCVQATSSYPSSRRSRSLPRMFTEPGSTPRLSSFIAQRRMP